MTARRESQRAKIEKRREIDTEENELHGVSPGMKESYDVGAFTSPPLPLSGYRFLSRYSREKDSFRLVAIYPRSASTRSLSIFLSLCPLLYTY